MKHLIISLTLFFLTSLLSAQTATDSVGIRCQYTMHWKNDISKQGYSKDLIWLDIGTNASICYSYYNYLRDSTFGAMRERGASIPEIMSKIRLMRTGVAYVMLKQQNNQILMVSNLVAAEHYYYTEPLPVPEWKLLSDTCTILSYLCYKATANFRGRTWETWYTPEIPLKEGPWQFSGLPGLILKLYDTKKEYYLLCSGLEKQSPKTAIIFKTSSQEGRAYNKVNRTEYRKLQRLYHEDALEFITMQTGASVSVNNPDGTSAPAKVPPKPYNPIEIE